MREYDLQAELILNAYEASMREMNDMSLTLDQRIAASTLFTECRRLVFSCSGLNM